MAHGAVIDANQFVEALDLVRSIGMPKPSGPVDRRVELGGQVDTGLWHGAAGFPTARPSGCRRPGPQIRIAVAQLVTAPADVGIAHLKDDRIGLEPSHSGDDPIPVVDVTVRARTVEPHLDEGT